MLQSRAVDFVNFSGRFIRLFFVITVGLVLLGSSNIASGDKVERVRAFTRGIEFDYLGWTVDALGLKFTHSSQGLSHYIEEDQQIQLIFDYLNLITGIHQKEHELQSIFANPSIDDPLTASEDVKRELSSLYDQRSLSAPVTEEVLQGQMRRVIADLGIGPGGQPFPPVLYHNTPLPYALIVSPRDIIRQDADISLIPGLSLEEQVALEEVVDQELDASSLVVPIGGVGVYPTMVQETNNLVWLSEVVAHEWVHNFLTLRPLGINYFSSPELRVMNETTASIAGKEIGLALLEKFYPELVPPAPPEESHDVQEPAEPPAFDFRSEMHETRLKVDELLAEGQIEEAEAYMEARREFFWDHGYQIRKLNQAYFAFYGAYADEPGGPAGAAEDPVGEAVRKLREQSPSLAAFINRMSWLYKFEQLERIVNNSA